MRISGKNLKFMMDGLKLNAQKWTLDITDNTTVTKTNGVPDGYVEGDVEASGELELNTSNFNLLMKVAQRAGSFRGIKPFDAMGFGKTDRDELKVDMFGIKLKIASLIDADSNGGSALMHKIQFDVTDPDFVNINGVPYLAREETVDIIG